ncbi:unnamed protein product [Phaedon cochleariae]|uniref:MADF domain-containing protein n=1 Tax=Phaedon cochleariae TaxID=80249 RepID=A0A9N9SG80_PHACE|nr:unnamed protein product [Phaedon cochleariae]
MDTDGQLIELVEQFSFIYDKKHVDFKNKLVKENAWQSISEIMLDTAESVAARWTILRNRYATEKRRERSIPSGSGAYNTWHLFKEMQFLDEFYNPRRTLGNVSATAWSNSDGQSQQLSQQSSQLSQQSSQLSQQSSHQSTQQSSLWNDQIIIEDDAMEAATAGPSTNTSCTDVPVSRKALEEHNSNIKTLRGKRNKYKAFEETVIKAFDQIGTYLQTPEVMEDEDMLFAKSVGKSLQTIINKKDKASRAKIEILEVIEKYSD